MYLIFLGKGVLQMCLGAASLLLMLKAQAEQNIIYMLLSIVPIALGILIQMSQFDRLKRMVVQSIVDDINYYT